MADFLAARNRDSLADLKHDSNDVTLPSGLRTTREDPELAVARADRISIGVTAGVLRLVQDQLIAASPAVVRGKPRNRRDLSNVSSCDDEGLLVELLHARSPQFELRLLLDRLPVPTAVPTAP